MDERKKIEQAIAALDSQRQLLGDEIVDESIAQLRGKLATQAFSAPIQRRKQVTLLLADISGFTAMSEHMDAEDVRQMIHALWERLDKVILEQGGHIDKHIGDAVLSIWGVDMAQEGDPARAVRAGLLMQQEVAAFASRDKVNLQLRIGVHTGPVILGEVGTQGEFTAVGDAVNLVGELEKSAPVGQVLISSDTGRLVRGLFETSEEFSLPVKGRAAPLQVCQVTGIRPYAFKNPTRGVDGVETRMVGRENELSQLQKAFREVVTRQTLHVVTISGEAGLGKSRLLIEFREWLETIPVEVVYFSSRSDEESLRQPFALVRQLFSSAFQIRESDSKAEMLSKFETGACEFLGAGNIEAAHVLGYMLGFDFSESVYVAGIREEAAQLHKRGLLYAAQFFQGVARQKPVILLFDDLHWADPVSVEFVEKIVQACSRDQVLIIFTARPNFFEIYPDWAKKWLQHQRLDLIPLTREDSRILVHDILRKLPDIPEAMQNMLWGNSEGNPFYLEELIKMLIEEGAIIKEENSWCVKVERLQGFQVPSTLTGVLQARLDHLSASERGLLQRAAVVGRIFWDDAIVFMDKAADRDVSAMILDSLGSKGLVFRQSQSVFENAVEYLFKHTILRDVTYEQVLKSLRREYHGRAAEWLILRAGDRVDEFAASIAHHYEMAGNVLQSGRWYARSAELARSVYSNSTAVNYYRKAMDFLSTSITPLERYRLCAGLGEVLRLQVRIDEAQQVFNFMISLAKEMGDVNLQANAMNRLSTVFLVAGRYQEALDISIKAGVSVRNAKDPDLSILAQSVFETGFLKYRLGDASELEHAGRESLELGERAGSQAQIASSCNLIGISLIGKGLYDQAVAFGLRSLEIWRALKHREYESDLLNNIGESYRLSGNAEKALEYYKDGYRIALEIDNKITLLGFLSNICAVYNLMGDYSSALGYIQDALEKVASDAYNIAEMHYNAAETYLGLGDINRACEHASNALQSAYQLPNPELLGHGWRVAGRVASANSDSLILPCDDGKKSFRADECFGKANGIFLKAAMERDQAITLWHWGVHKLREGDPEGSRQLFDEAHALFTRLNLPLQIIAMEKTRTGL